MTLEKPLFQKYTEKVIFSIFDLKLITPFMSLASLDCVAIKCEGESLFQDSRSIDIHRVTRLYPCPLAQGI